MYVTSKKYEIIHMDTRYWAVVLLLFSYSRAKINDLDVILHGFTYTTVFRVKRFNNLTIRV